MTIITLMVVMMMMLAMMVKMISNLLLGVGEGIGSVGWDGGFFDGLGGAGGTLLFEVNYKHSVGKRSDKRTTHLTDLAKRGFFCEFEKPLV